MLDLILAEPWWLFVSLIIVGGVVFWSANNRGQKQARYAGLALIGIALLLKALSFFVETDQAIVTRHTNELVKAVQDRDWTRFSSLLDPDVSLGTSMGTLFGNSKVLVEGARSDCEQYDLKNVSASITDVAQDNAGITVDISARSEQTASMGYPVPSSWKLIWDKTGKDWHVHEITCLSIGQEKADQLGHLIAGH